MAILDDIRVQQDDARMASELERCSFVDAREVEGVRCLKVKLPETLYGQQQAEAALREAGARLFGGFDVEFVERVSVDAVEGDPLELNGGQILS